MSLDIYIQELLKLNNQIIDDYMGNVWDINHPDFPKYSIRLKNCIQDRFENPPKYNESWDLIIPVTKKVLSDLQNFGESLKPLSIKDKRIMTKEYKNENDKLIEKIYQNYAMIKYYLEELDLDNLHNQLAHSIEFINSKQIK